MNKTKVLFVCTYHGARSLAAAHFARKLATENLEVSCSCFESGRISSFVREILKEQGIIPPSDPLKTVYCRYREKEIFDYVVTLCHEVTTEQCPVFKKSVDTLYSKDADRISWSVPDFYSLRGNDAEKMAQARAIVDIIKSEVLQFLSLIGCLRSDVRLS